MEYKKIKKVDQELVAFSEHFLKNRLTHLASLALLLTLAFLAHSGIFSHITDALGGGHMQSVNQRYLEAATHKDTELLELLSLSKVALAVLKSSEGGVSFFIDIQVQLGQSLNVIDEMVNYAWKSSLTALIAIKSMALLLDLSRLSMTPVLTLLFCFMGLSLGLRKHLPTIGLALSDIARLMLFAVLVVHIVVPLSIYGVAASSHHFFNEHKTAVHQNFSSVHAILPGHDYKAGLHTQVEGHIKDLKNNQAKIHQIASKLYNLTIKHITLVIFEYLLMPIIFLGVISYLFVLMLRRLWHYPEHIAR